MDCSQILPGAVNSGPCSLATGYYSEHPFIVYASGRDIVILDGRLKHVQTLLGSDLGYGETPINCVHCAELVGKIAVTWGSDVVIFHPELLDENQVQNNNEFPGHWILSHAMPLDYPVLSLSWNKDGKQLLIGGETLSLWTYSVNETISVLVPDQESSLMGEGRSEGVWGELWRCMLALPAVHLNFSPDGSMFATASLDDHFVKIWYHSKIGAGGIGTSHMFSYVYVAHPMMITGLAWRKTSSFMPKGCVPNVLLTYCRDNICRIWSHSVAQESSTRLRFFIAASIDPIADIPFKSMAPIEGMPFLVHWLNNKETTFTSKAEKTQKGSFLPLSRHSSLASFASSINEDMLQSWVCIEDTLTSPDHVLPRQPHVIQLENFLRPSSAVTGGGQKPQEGGTGRASMVKKLFASLMDEWCNSPDLLLCIHPGTGSLMVWTVEGLDAAHSSSRLVHVSFSSCLPHIFPPHLAQSLHSGLLQYLIKEPDVVHTREMALTGSLADISIPVPQIRLPSGGTVTGSMADIMKHNKEEVPKTKADSSLILISNHENGSIHAWSVELTVQSNYYTSIAGLIHWGGTGGHHLEVRAVYRHPWLPVLMTVSLENEKMAEMETESGRRHVDNELIIWNAHLPGPLEHKSGLHELSRMSSPDPLSFHFVTWVPPISVSSSAKKEILARSPSSGLFVANVGKELRLFQTSLYCTSKGSANQELNSSFASSQPDICITSHFGKEGIRSVGVVERDVSQFEEIVSLNAFRMCSLVTSHDIKRSLGAKFSKDVVIILIENRDSGRKSTNSSTHSSSAAVKQSYVHVWRVVLSTYQPVTDLLSRQRGPSDADQTNRSLPAGVGDLGYQAQVEKVLCSSLPLPHRSYVVHSSPACDIASSLQLQLPTLSAPFLFSTACSDSTLRCWQLSTRSTSDCITVEMKRQCVTDPIRPITVATGLVSKETKRLDGLEFELSEVFVGCSAPSSVEELSYRRACGLNLKENVIMNALPLESEIPCAVSNAYAGRMALAHLLTAAPESLQMPRRPSINPLGRYAAITIWECESTAGLRWLCEANLLLTGVGGVSHETQGSQADTVHLEWLPMENGAYLLATCFESIISIFGMALPQVEGDFSKLVSSNSNRFLPKKKSSSSLLTSETSKVSWVCLLQFPCAKRYPGLSISQFAYTGSNSLLISVGTEIHIYSCMVRGSKLEAFTPTQKERRAVSKSPSRVFRQRESSEGSTKLTDSDIINLLDFAHARNTPLPQYHPKILLELMNSGKLYAVKAILVNLVKYLLLYESRRKTSEEEDDKEMSYMYGKSDRDEFDTAKRKRMLSITSDGQLRRSHGLGLKVEVETIPSLSLSKLGIFGTSSPSVPEPDTSTRQDHTDKASDVLAEETEEDDLFTLTTELATLKEDFSFMFDENNEKELTFSDVNPFTSDLTPEMSTKLSAILQYAQLAELSDLEQVRLMAIAETVANTRMAFERTQTSAIGQVGTVTGDAVLNLSLTAGAGYASTGLTQGIGGGEAMDECGIRYLLALKNYISLSESLPSGVRPGRLSSSDFIWAFHSDAEMELLAALPCVQKDVLKWSELRNVGVGWWLRSLETLRRLMEKLAKTQFMKNQDPLDASLLYLALKKKSLLKGLFRTVGDSRMTQFFGQDFSSERWKKAALKNAFALLSKQRFLHAAAFFLLGGKLWDACEVCISRLGDLQLALVIARLYEGDGGLVYEKILKGTILGISDVSTPSGVGGKREKLSFQGEPNPDCFIRSIACWLLQDYSMALETLLLSDHTAGFDGTAEKSEYLSKSPNPSIFNFYFFLRSQPLLIRRNQHDYRSLGAKSHPLLPPMSPHESSCAGKQPLSSVGEEPLTALERNLLFSTAYHHLNHGCPLLALDVLSKLPKSSSLGADLNCDRERHADPNRDGLRGVRSEATMKKKSRSVEPTASLTGMIQSGTLRGFDFGHKSLAGPTDSVREEEEEEDWSHPVSSNRTLGTHQAKDDLDWSQPVSRQPAPGQQQQEEEDIDWSKPITACMLSSDGGGGGDMNGDNENDFDWSKPVSAHFDGDEKSPSLSPPNFSNNGLNPLSLDAIQLEGSDDSSALPSSKTTLSSQGLFILSLAEQLQYNACLSILTEELITIYIPPCCDHLWERGGKESLPLLPLAKQHGEKCLAAHYKGSAFEKTVLSLRGMLVVWLRKEMNIVKGICGVDNSREDLEQSSEEYVPAGYDLLTTLMNYASLHAGTTPSLITVKLELMHLMNTLLPWSTQPTVAEQDAERDNLALTSVPSDVPTCAVDPSQLPILTSCSLPAKHLTNLALHLRLMSASIIEVLANHTCPPISSKPLPHVHKVFELCCAISNSITVCLSPINITDIAPDLLSPTSLSGHTMSGIATPVVPGGADFSQSFDARHRERSSPKTPQRTTHTKSGGSPLNFISDLLGPPVTPNTKASKWPGVAKWPKALQSDEGKDPTPMSLILAECCIAVYVGLVSIAWSWHSISDLLLLIRNCPSLEFWYQAFGGGLDMKLSEEKGGRKGGGGGGVGEKSAFMKRVDSMKKGIKMLRKSASQVGEPSGLGLFVAPQKTLLDLFLGGTEDDKSGSEQGITFAPHRTLSEASTISPHSEEDDEIDGLSVEEGPTFRLGSLSKKDDVRDPKNPDSFPWCLINLCITKLVQEAAQKILSTAGLEVLELVTASPLLYSTLKVLDEWESIFARRLDALETDPEDLFTKSGDESGPMFTGVGPAVMRHRFILEPENSPFQGQATVAREARQLWEYLVHRDECRELFIHHIFANKLSREGSAESNPNSRSLYKAVDSVVSSFCIHPGAQFDPTIMAVALPREVLEIEIPDTAGLDTVPYGDNAGDMVSMGPTATVPKRSQSVAFTGTGDFIMVQALRGPGSPTSSLEPSRRYPSLGGGLHTQTGTHSSILLRRNVVGVKKIVPHPSMAYYLTGSMDGSVKMWEFGTQRVVSQQRMPGTPSITEIRFTPQGNKYGVTDTSGKLSLWQGIHTSTKTPYKVLASSMRYLSDFLFLGSSSLIAACGDAQDNRNLVIWDTLLPTKQNVVKEYVCHEAGGASVLGYSQLKQRMYSGGRRGEVCIYDIRQNALIQCLSVHSSSITCMVVNDVEGYLVTGSAEGDIKVLDLTSMDELACYTNQHAKSRLFRQEGGITKLIIKPGGRLYSGGVDGSIRVRTLP